MNKLASWESSTGTKPTIESDRSIATVSFPFKSALQQNDAKNDVDVPVNVPVNVPQKVSQRYIKIRFSAIFTPGK